MLSNQEGTEGGGDRRQYRKELQRLYKSRRYTGEDRRQYREEKQKLYKPRRWESGRQYIEETNMLNKSMKYKGGGISANTKGIAEAIQVKEVHEGKGSATMQRVNADAMLIKQARTK